MPSNASTNAVTNIIFFMVVSPGNRNRAIGRAVQFQRATDLTFPHNVAPGN
jgi:hypothetical protein